MNVNKNTTEIDTTAVFKLSDRIPAHQISGYREAMTGNWCNTILSDAFFSGKNIQIIQNGIRSGVYKMSNGQYIIGNQNIDQLKIIMRSIYLQNSRNQSDNIQQQIIELNNLVLDYAIEQVYGEAQGYMRYKEDSSSLVVPLEHPVMSKSNDKQLVQNKLF
tara:strand:- start:38 stop:520 length:483 start_codon:yes stop_codon:yes gene_type:complete